jgi:DNA-binding NarL/FixJ family response regulator
MFQLSLRERELLKLMAAGYSNAGIANELFLAPKTVEAHVRSIFRKLNLPQGDMAHRRVCAVLLYLRATGALQPARPQLRRVA